MPNPYFDALGLQESPLYNDLIRESIYNHGIGALYLPRENHSVDDILGKTEGAFSDSYEIDVVITETNNLDQDSEMFQSFGVQIDKSVSFMVHKDTFDSKVASEPVKGDLIYLPAWDLLLTIEDPDSMNILQFGNKFTYQFRTIIYENSGEEFDTGITDIDDNAMEYSNDMTAVNNQTDAISDRFNELVQFSEDNPFSSTF